MIGARIPRPDLFDDPPEESPGEVAFFKVFELFILYATISLAWQWGRYLPRIDSIVLELGLANYLDVSVMFGSWQGPLVAALVTAAALAGFFRLSRYGYPIAMVLLVWQYAARFCLGEIPHSSNLAGMTLLAIALSHLAFDTPRARRRFTMGFTYLAVGLAYTSAGICKLIATGIRWPDGRHLQIWIYEKTTDSFSKFGEWDFGYLQSLVLEHQAVGTVVLTIGLLTELLAFLLWWRPLRTPVCLAICALHLGIFQVMGILFELSLYELALIGLPWAGWMDKFLASEQGHAIPIERMARRFA